MDQAKYDSQLLIPHAQVTTRPSLYEPDVVETLKAFWRRAVAEVSTGSGLSRPTLWLSLRQRNLKRGTSSQTSPRTHARTCYATPLRAPAAWPSQTEAEGLAERFAVRRRLVAAASPQFRRR